MVICLQRDADLHMAQLMPLPLTVSCFSKIQIGFTFLVPAHPGSPGKRAVKRVCVCLCVCVCYDVSQEVKLAFNCSKSCCFSVGRRHSAKISDMALGPETIAWCDNF